MDTNRLKDPGFLDEKAKSRSFRDILTGDSSSPVFPLLKVASHHGMPALFISDEEMLSLALPFEFALVGKFPGRRPPLDTIRKFFFNLKLFGDFSITLLNPKNVLIKLVNDLYYCRVFSHRSYFVGNCFMKLFKWTPHFDVTVESPIVPIWISFSCLRPHLFSPRILHGLGSLFGRPLRTDNATSVGSRPFVARILVELDVTKRYASQVWLGSESMSYIQSVEMEKFPSYCFHCKSLGHLKDCCPILFPSLGDPPALVEVNSVPNEGVALVNQNLICEHDTIGSGFPLFNNVVPVLPGSSQAHANVLFNNSGGFIPPETAVDGHLGGSEVVVGGSLILAANDVVGDCELGMDEEVCLMPAVVMVSPPVVCGDAFNSLDRIGEEVLFQVSTGVSGPDCLVEVPISVLSPDDLYAHCNSSLGVTCLGSSSRFIGSPSSSCAGGDVCGVELDESLLDLYGLNVCQAGWDGSHGVLGLLLHLWAYPGPLVGDLLVGVAVL
ncbi:hypothetical protein M5K25_022856 [Dendrobium thyrsiflorum]|uniref:DUF4283 domain-containing protein n=1 Tax=Dendrobium thyrsiflorum TaxID=117978 RepID=A0ABD0UDD1_DENTH